MDGIVLVGLNRNTVYTPLALLYCRACLTEDKKLSSRVRVDIREYELEDSEEYILWDLAKFAPGIVGFSCYLWNIKKVLKLSRMLRKAMPGIKIVLGGPEVSPLAKGILKDNPCVDLVVRGEGEFAFTDIARAYLTGKGLSGVKGITFRKGKKVFENPGHPFIADLDSIPSAYLNSGYELANREVCLETQRGCVFGCWFCYYNKGCANWRVFSLKRVKKELLFLLSQDQAEIYLMDPVFNIDIKRAKEICRFIIEHNKKRIPFHTEIQAELVDAELAALLKKACVRYIEVGLQSDDDKVLKNVRRAFNREKFIKGFSLLKSNGLVVELQLILGLPGDCLETFFRSLKFALELDPPVLSVFKLQVLPGTMIRERARSLGIEYEAEPPYEFIQSRTMPFKDSILAQKAVNSVSLFRRNKAALRLCKQKGIDMVQLIRLWLDHTRSDDHLLNNEDNNALSKEAAAFLQTCRRCM
ncbi:MAG: radical SAM protein [Candidatus Omnitrophica bacterium]|jgi:anaerobic magnesium-protoporphyrin IX monomethyl ester cyclase|nr:B12-binding domain-containing radical SAM protein [Candidatus Omnitrophota bacterium]MDD5080091.1 radical SAM protein [Candidatus Omnitrophota bacterium]